MLRGYHSINYDTRVRETNSSLTGQNSVRATVERTASNSNKLPTIETP